MKILLLSKIQLRHTKITQEHCKKFNIDFVLCCEDLFSESMLKNCGLGEAEELITSMHREIYFISSKSSSDADSSTKTNATGLEFPNGASILKSFGQQLCMDVNELVIGLGDGLVLIGFNNFNNPNMEYKKLKNLFKCLKPNEQVLLITSQGPALVSTSVSFKNPNNKGSIGLKKLLDNDEVGRILLNIHSTNDGIWGCCQVNQVTVINPGTLDDVICIVEVLKKHERWIINDLRYIRSFMGNPSH